MADLFKKFLTTEQEQSFVSAAGTNEVHCLHDLHDLVIEFTRGDFLKTFEKLIQNWKYEVDVHLKTMRDEQATTTVSKNQTALEEFKKGQSLLFNDVNRQEPELEDWLHNIRLKLELCPQTFSRCLVYATPKGGGNAPHFDQNINFVLQLSGEKTWWTAPNSSLKNPMHRHVIGEDTDPELKNYIQNQMPTSFPESSSESFRLKTGSLLFVPAGVWHKTEAHSDALSLNFTFSVPTWLDLVNSALRDRLMQSEIWREQAKGLSKPEQIDKVDFLIQHLASDISNWSAADLLNSFDTD